MSEQISSLDLIWELLYAEKFETEPDPNKEENQVRAKVKKGEHIEALKRLKNGPGKPLFEMLDNRLKKSIISLLADPQYRNCGCPAAQLIVQINSIISLLVDVERTMQEATK